MEFIYGFTYLLAVCHNCGFCYFYADKISSDSALITFGGNDLYRVTIIKIRS